MGSRAPQQDVKPPSAVSAHLRSFGIGVFYALYLYVFDRCIHLKGGVNIGAAVAMSLIAFMLTIGMIKVREDSQYARPLKFLTVLVSFIVALIGIYAFFGFFKDADSFMQQIVWSKTLPPALQEYADQFLGFAKAHAVFGPHH